MSFYFNVCLGCSDIDDIYKISLNELIDWQYIETACKGMLDNFRQSIRYRQLGSKWVDSINIII